MKMPEVTPTVIANIMFQAAKGDDKLPPLRQVCSDFPPTVTLMCRDMFIDKVREGEMPSKDLKAMEKIVVAIDKRFKLNKTVCRSPSPSLHRLLKEEK